jgi:hypothetical protein
VLCGEGTSGNGEDIKKGGQWVNMVETFRTHICTEYSGKMRPVETIPGMREGE